MNHANDLESRWLVKPQITGTLSVAPFIVRAQMATRSRCAFGQFSMNKCVSSEFFAGLERPFLTRSARHKRKTYKINVL